MQWNHVTTLHSNIPKVNQGIAEIMEKLGKPFIEIFGSISVQYLKLTGSGCFKRLSNPQIYMFILS